MPHFVDLERGPGKSNFLLQFAFKIALKPVLVTVGRFRLIFGGLRKPRALKIRIPAADL